MTADARRAALVFNARTAAEKVYGTQFFNEEIEAALDLALEEAAMVADRYEIPMAETSATHIAAAIRSLKSKEPAR